MNSFQAYEMTLGVHVGLAGFNVTLRTIARHFDVLLDGGLKQIDKNQTPAPKIYYNEYVRETGSFQRSVCLSFKL